VTAEATSDTSTIPNPPVASKSTHTTSARQDHVAPLPSPPATQQSLHTTTTQQSTRQPTPPPPTSAPYHVEPSPLSLAQPDAPLQTNTLSSSPLSGSLAPAEALAAPTTAEALETTQHSDNASNPVSGTLQVASTPAPSSPRAAPTSSPTQLAGQKRKRPTPPPSAVTSQNIAPSSPTQPIASQDAAASTVESDHEAALINTLTNQQEQSAAPMAQMIPTKLASAAPKPRAKRQRKTPAANPLAASDDHQADGGAETDATAAAAKAKPTKPRASRAKCPPKSAATVAEDDDGNMVVTEETARPAPKPRKPRQKKQQKQLMTEPIDGQNGDSAQDDPMDDPENHEIDVTATAMFELKQDTGLGKVSERETKMAAIDWDEVHKKRLLEAEAIRGGRDPATANSQPTENNDDAEGGAGENTQETPQPTTVASGPRLRLDHEGNLVVDEESLRIDRQAQAARNAENLVVTENDDLTKRVNQMSWINERRRDPTDRVPFFKMKSDPWSDEETDRFYEALRMFGTDFFIISKMFVPKTRRQIKLKFIREERLDPDRVNRVLAGEGVAMNLESFAEATGQDVEGFKDPRELEEELRVEGEEQRVEIARKKKEIEEAKAQRDIQMAAREKDQEDRAAQRREKAAMRGNRRRGIFGTGTF
jgi:transcription factor TFIIIB component B''